MDLVLAAALGLLIGGVVGAVGGGGAILALPVLVYVLDQGATPATTASLIVVAIGASVGALAHAREGHLCWRVALAFAAPAAVGAYLGTLANTRVGARTLVLAFVPLMLIAAASTYARGGKAPPDAEQEGGCPRPRMPAVGASGLGVGALTGFFGVGGGFVIVPALTMLLGLPMRRAIATSLAIITFTGIAALVSHLVKGAEPNWPLTILLAAAAAVGALAGTKIGRRLRPATLAHAFGVIVAVIGLLLLVDVLLLGGPPT
jgi:uncharacterized membrane protein YfcA